MGDYAVVINFSFDDGEQRSIVIDTIQDVSVNDSSTVTDHPIVTGDMVSDHMIREPITMSINGSLSTSSSTASSMLITNNKIDLIVSQEIFTRIKNEGVLCEIYKISVNDKNIKFMRRRNMVLNNITWTEKINSVDFSFSFREVILADIQEYEVNMDDNFLPNVQYPVTKSFTETLIDWEKVDGMVTKAAFDVGVVTHDFLVGMSGFTVAGLVGIGIGYAVAHVLVSLGVCTGPIGLAIGTVIMVSIAAIGYLINLVKSFSYKIKQFKYYKNSRKFEKEVKRYGDFISSIHNQLEQLNTALQVYQVNYNGEQECLVTIDNEYYIFTFKKNNVLGTYGLEVQDLNSNPVDLNSTDVKSALVGFDECTLKNELFRTPSKNYHVYLMCPDGDRNDLTNYYILVSKINPEDYNKQIYEIVKNALMY